MISFQLNISNIVAYDAESRRIPNQPWERRESVLISSVDRTIPVLLEEGKKVVAARPGVYTCARVSAELLDNDGFTLGDYWPEPLYFAVAEDTGKIIFKGVKQ